MSAKQYARDVEDVEATEETLEQAAATTSRIGTFLALFLGGAAIGAIAALLAAPRTGRETRKRVGGYLRSGQAAIGQVPSMLRRSSR